MKKMAKPERAARTRRHFEFDALRLDSKRALPAAGAIRSPAGAMVARGSRAVRSRARQGVEGGVIMSKDIKPRIDHSAWPEEVRSKILTEQAFVREPMLRFHAFCNDCFARGMTAEDVIRTTVDPMVMGLADSRPHDVVRAMLIEAIDECLLLRTEDPEEVKL